MSVSNFALRVVVGLALIASPALGVAAENAPARIAPSAQQFLNVIRTHFAAWNTSGDGNLTKSQIEVAMQNPVYKGDAGATLAALKWALQIPLDDKSGAPPRGPVTLAALDAFEKALTGGPKTDVAVLADAARRFPRMQKIVATASRALFADGSPHLAAIRQAWDSDCYFNSGVGAVAYASPLQIVRMIQPAGDGAFIVTFPGKAPQKAPAPTDAEIAAYTNADGVWFNVLEKAFAAIRPFAPGKATDEPLDSVTLVAGSEYQVVQLVSGHRIDVTRFPHATGKPATDALVAGVRRDLAAALRDRRAVVASKYHHAYAVVAFDPRIDTVTIHNPYDGDGFEPLPNGERVVSSGGYFSLSTPDFVENFNGMGVESSAPARL